MATWTLRKRLRFEASHQLPHHDGKCARLHGHSWVATIKVRGHRLVASGPEAGMVADFGRIAEPAKRLVEECLDHYHLNDTTGLENPTSEELARWMYERLRPSIPGLVSVEVEETCTSACEYEPGGAW